MARATSEPEIVIMDEPTTALDVVVQRDILVQIVELKERLGFSILFITHDLSLLLELADRIAVMYAGQLLEIGSADAIQHAPAHPYTKGLLNSFPSLRGARRELAGIPGAPPDLRRPPPGCPFLPRCGYGTDGCTNVTMTLVPVTAATGPSVVAELLAMVNPGSAGPVGAVWDSHHPYRMGESPAEVAGNLAGRILLAQVKDARRAAQRPDGWQLVLLGHGEVPVPEMLTALAGVGYRGWISVEWEKRWHPEIEEPEIALPQHLAVLTQWMDGRGD